MSKDSSHTYLHMHHPRLADFFEDFTRSHTSLATSSTSTVLPTGTTATAGGTANASTSAAAATTTGGGGGGGGDITTTGGGGSSGLSTIPSFLPIEDIYVPPQYQPVNPEDEDDVVPDQHAAFGITRAMDARREPVWRDFGLEELVRRGGGGGGNRGSSLVAMTAGRRVDTRLKDAGRLMGGRRTLCLR